MFLRAAASLKERLRHRCFAEYLRSVSPSDYFGIGSLSGDSDQRKLFDIPYKNDLFQLLFMFITMIRNSIDIIC